MEKWFQQESFAEQRCLLTVNWYRACYLLDGIVEVAIWLTFCFVLSFRKSLDSSQVQNWLSRVNLNSSWSVKISMTPDQPAFSDTDFQCMMWKLFSLRVHHILFSLLSPTFSTALFFLQWIICIKWMLNALRKTLKSGVSFQLRKSNNSLSRASYIAKLRNQGSNLLESSNNNFGSSIFFELFLFELCFLLSAVCCAWRQCQKRSSIWTKSLQSQVLPKPDRSASCSASVGNRRQSISPSSEPAIPVITASGRHRFLLQYLLSMIDGSWITTTAVVEREKQGQGMQRENTHLAWAVESMHQFRLVCLLPSALLVPVQSFSFPFFLPLTVSFPVLPCSCFCFPSLVLCHTSANSPSFYSFLLPALFFLSLLFISFLTCYSFHWVFFALGFPALSVSVSRWFCLSALCSLPRFRFETFLPSLSHVLFEFCEAFCCGLVSFCFSCSFGEFLALACLFSLDIAFILAAPSETGSLAFALFALSCPKTGRQRAKKSAAKQIPWMPSSCQSMQLARSSQTATLWPFGAIQAFSLIRGGC